MTTEMTTKGGTIGGCHSSSAARHHALADVAAHADSLADAATAALARCSPGEDRDYLRARWDQLCRIAHSLRSAPGYRLPPNPEPDGLAGRGA